MRHDKGDNGLGAREGARASTLAEDAKRPPPSNPSNLACRLPPPPGGAVATGTNRLRDAVRPREFANGTQGTVLS